jgi:hypothetical protein
VDVAVLAVVSRTTGLQIADTDGCPLRDSPAFLFENERGHVVTGAKNLSMAVPIARSHQKIRMRGISPLETHTLYLMFSMIDPRRGISRTDDGFSRGIMRVTPRSA